MARGAHSPGPVQLPKAEFMKVVDIDSQPAGVHDPQARSFGYNDGTDFERPVRYIKYIEPLDTDLDKQVEYDMDEQDQDWLDGVNHDRMKEQVGKVAYETFEVLMDRLEKEWFILTKNLPQPDYAMPSEDSTCAICDDSEGENMNAIVFCDGCNLAVHQDCYGVPYIPEGQWLCRKCTVSPESAVSCVLCPNEGGAFKQTVNGEWVHLLCAIWVPETRVANDVFMEPVNGVDRIPKQRWKLRCGECGIREGACIQCAKNSCYEAFHVTCARREKYLMPMKSVDGGEAVLACYCDKHLPPEQAKVRETMLLERDSDPSALPTGRSAKTARAYAKSYASGPPLVPAIIVERVLQYIAKVSVRKKPELVLQVCKYWSLKREARRGAPLLKRLHLEPWTATAGGAGQSDEEKGMKLEQMKRLRAELERVRSMADLVRQREAVKLQQVEVTNETLTNLLYPHENEMRVAFERICQVDRKDYFKNPVSKIEVPDYFEVIKEPMCWSTIQAKLDRHEYWDVHSFRHDVHLVIENAIRYNRSDSPFCKTAYRMRGQLSSIFEKLQKDFTKPEPDDVDMASPGKPNGIVKPEIPLAPLEPPLAMLDLLIQSHHIAADSELILDSEPISSLFNYEHGVFKPPPTPPPPPSPPPAKSKAKKKKRDDATRRKLARDTIAAMDAAPGFRSTRGSAARAAVLEDDYKGEPIAGPSEGSTPDPEASTSTVGETKKRKRPQARLPEKAEVLPLVEDVDSHSSFNMFDMGWILPEGQKRRGRAEREALPPPPPPEPKKAAQSRKPARTYRGRQKSLLSESTAASENQTLPTEPPATSEEDILDDAESRMSSLTPAPSSDYGDAPMDVEEEPSEALKEEEEEVLVDTDALDHLDAAKMDEEPTALAEEPVVPAEELATPTEEPNMVTEQPSEIAAPSPPHALPEDIPLPTPETPEDEAPLPISETLEDDEVNEAVEQQQPEEPESPQRPQRIKKPANREPRIVIDVIDSPATRREKKLQRQANRDSETVPDGEESVSAGPSVVKPACGRPRKSGVSGPSGLAAPPVVGEEIVTEPGTLVWAKLPKWPFWPGAVVDPEDAGAGVPPGVLTAQADGKILVHFYDRNNSWGWLGPQSLRLLGENEAVDRHFLSKATIKNKALRKECEKGYREALKSMNTASDDTASQAAEERQNGDGADETPAAVDNNASVQEESMPVAFAVDDSKSTPDEASDPRPNGESVSAPEDHPTAARVPEDGPASPPGEQPASARDGSADRMMDVTV